VLTVARGWPIVAFALGGFLLSSAYTAPPLRLKKHGLGEPTVLVVWGPLMVGGVYYAATGTIPGAGSVDKGKLQPCPRPMAIAGASALWLFPTTAATPAMPASSSGARCA
jgi:1,4-dihydroxy-2-naphthoate octaprenyltransferase